MPPVFSIFFFFPSGFIVLDIFLKDVWGFAFGPQHPMVLWIICWRVHSPPTFQPHWGKSWCIVLPKTLLNKVNAKKKTFILRAGPQYNYWGTVWIQAGYCTAFFQQMGGICQECHQDDVMGCVFLLAVCWWGIVGTLFWHHFHQFVQGLKRGDYIHLQIGVSFGSVWGLKKKCYLGLWSVHIYEFSEESYADQQSVHYHVN